MYGNQGFPSPCKGPFPYTYSNLYVSRNLIVVHKSASNSNLAACDTSHRRSIKKSIQNSMCFADLATIARIGQLCLNLSRFLAIYFKFVDSSYLTNDRSRPAHYQLPVRSSKSTPPSPHAQGSRNLFFSSAMVRVSVSSESLWGSSFLAESTAWTATPESPTSSSKNTRRN